VLQLDPWKEVLEAIGGSILILFIAVVWGERQLPIEAGYGPEQMAGIRPIGIENSVEELLGSVAVKMMPQTEPNIEGVGLEPVPGEPLHKAYEEGLLAGNIGGRLLGVRLALVPFPPMGHL
jgi:hypothetical protein